MKKDEDVKQVKNKMWAMGKPSIDTGYDAKCVDKGKMYFRVVAKKVYVGEMYIMYPEAFDLVSIVDHKIYRIKYADVQNISME